MAASTSEKEFVTYVVDMMQSIGPVYAKGMFGGHGIFLEGLMFALIIKGVLYLKVDKESKKVFKQRGLGAFTYNRQGKECALSYYQAPEEVLDDSGKMADWANRAFCVALKAASKN